MTALQTERPDSSIDTVLLGSLRNGWERSEHIIREMFDAPVSFGDPAARVVDALEVQAGSIAVAMEFSGSRAGLGLLAVSRATARGLVASMLGCSETDDAVLPMLVPAVLELGNVVLNAIIGDVGERLSERYRFEVPTSLAPNLLPNHEARADMTGCLNGRIAIGDQPPAELVVGVVLHAEGGSLT